MSLRSVSLSLWSSFHFQIKWIEKYKTCKLKAYVEVVQEGYSFFATRANLLTRKKPVHFTYLHIRNGTAANISIIIIPYYFGTDQPQKKRAKFGSSCQVEWRIRRRWSGSTRIFSLCAVCNLRLYASLLESKWLNATQLKQRVVCVFYNYFSRSSSFQRKSSNFQQLLQHSHSYS